MVTTSPDLDRTEGPDSEQARLDALRSYEVIDSVPEPMFDALAELAAYVTGARSALISFVDDHRQWVKARYAVGVSETHIAFCAATILGTEPMVVEDARLEPRFAASPLSIDGAEIRFYAGVPLVMAGGHAIGVLAVLDQVPRVLDPAQRQALTMLAHQVVALLELRKLAVEARREGVDRFERLSRATNDAVWDWDLATDALAWNSNFETLFGYAASEVEPGIESWTTRLHPDDLTRVKRGILALIQTGGAAWSDEYRFRRRDGSYADIYDRGYVLRSAGAPVRMIGAMMDISERRRLEEQVRRSQRLDALGQLSGGIAHDFNNLLTVIQVNASLLAVGQQDPVLEEHARDILQASERATKLTRQLLLMGRKQVMQQVSVDLNAIVANMTRMLMRVLGEHELVTRCQPELPAVRGDIGMLEQVLLNLVVNARDAMPGGGQITVITGVTASATPPDGLPLGRYVWIRIDDTGAGIAPELVPRIFEPFFTTKEMGKGTGLGLATVYGITRQHQGWVDVASVPGSGSSFCCYLPAVEGLVTAPPAPAPAREESPRGSETILVAEDEPALRKIVTRLLVRLGYSVLQAGSGAEAVALWKQHEPAISLLLTDMVMPGGMSGRALAAALRADRPGLRVIYTSGFTRDDESPEEPLIEGVNFIPKPYRPQILGKLVRARLDD